MRGDDPLSWSTPIESSAEFPACAGMIRGMMIKQLALRGVPACAGMIRGMMIKQLALRGVPRMRGDDPSLKTNKVAEVASSPHARG